jgi:hypothetical protein
MRRPVTLLPLGERLQLQIRFLLFLRFSYSVSSFFSVFSMFRLFPNCFNTENTEKNEDTENSPQTEANFLRQPLIFVATQHVDRGSGSRCFRLNTYALDSVE